jgi:glycosyltransferase involved in cell wall biosynthesis
MLCERHRLRYDRDVDSKSILPPSAVGLYVAFMAIQFKLNFYANRVMVFPPLQLLFQLLNFTKPLPYDIVHVFGPLCLAFVPLLPLFYLRSVKIYVSYHVFLEFYKNIYLGSSDTAFKIMEFLFSITYFLPFVWFADMVGIPSKTADRVVFRYAKKIHIMKSGLKTDIFKPLSELDGTEAPWSYLTRSSTAQQQQQQQGPTLVYVGRLAGEKNIEFLIRAMGSPQLQGYTLVIVGDGPCRGSLETLAAKTVGQSNVVIGHGMEGDAVPAMQHPKKTHRHQQRSHDSAYAKDDVSSESSSELYGTDDEASDLSDESPRSASFPAQIVFTGMILSESVVAAHYAHADVFVSASASETFGFTVAEAMACGTPAVVVRSGAFASVYACIDDWMFHPEDIQDYVNKVVRVVGDGMEAREFSRKIAVQKYGVERAVKDLLTAYIMIVDGTYPSGSYSSSSVKKGLLSSDSRVSSSIEEMDDDTGKKRK